MKRQSTRSAAALKFKPRPTLFWDVDPKTIDPKKHATYIIERIMDFGNDAEVRWMWHFYPKQKLRTVVNNSRIIHPKSKVLWSLLTKTQKG